jgi:hypothetical protein
MATEKDYNFFLDQMERWRKSYWGFFIVIKNEKLCGAYQDEPAVEANARKYGDDLLIMYIGDEVKEYTLK